jgi:hypothetical protein
MTPGLAVLLAAGIVTLAVALWLGHGSHGGGGRGPDDQPAPVPAPVPTGRRPCRPAPRRDHRHTLREGRRH